MVQGNKNRILFLHTGLSTDMSITRMLRRICESIELEVLDISVLVPDFAEQLLDRVDDDLDSIRCVISLNVSAFYHFNVSGECLHDKLGLPLVVFFVDHPAQFMESVPENLDNAMVLLIDPDFENFWHKYYPGKTLTHLCNLMPFSDHEASEPPTFRQYRQRTKKIFAPLQMSYKNMNAIQWWDFLNQLVPPMNTIAQKAVTSMINNTAQGIDQFIDQAIEEEGAELLPTERYKLTVYVEGFAKMWRREIIVGSLMEFPIVVSSGHIPEKFRSEYEHKFIDTEGEETSRLYGEFQLVLNVSPAIPNLVQDRVINCVNAASTLISENNLGISQYLVPDKDFVDFPFDSEVVQEKVGNILEDPQRAYDMAVSAYTSLRNNDARLQHWRDIFKKALEMRQT